MGTALTMTKDAFERTIADNDIVLIDFWAAWCGPCRMFAPVFEEAAAANPDIVFAKVDTEDQGELAASFGIRSIPTLMIFRDQILVYSRPGALPKAALDDLISQVRALDMDEVRAEIAKAEASTPA
jgi:thioredoxin 1